MKILKSNPTFLCLDIEAEHNRVFQIAFNSHKTQYYHKHGSAIATRADAHGSRVSLRDGNGDGDSATETRESESPRSEFSTPPTPRSSDSTPDIHQKHSNDGNRAQHQLCVHLIGQTSHYGSPSSSSVNGKRTSSPRHGYSLNPLTRSSRRKQTKTS
jgi:hypothetical protein